MQIIKMFSRKVPNSVFNTKHNLTNSTLINNNHNTSMYYFFRYNFTINEVRIKDVYKNIRNVKEKMKNFINHGILMRAIQDSFNRVPNTIRNQSAGVLRVWAHQCECVLAQRLRRGQQMFCLYTKLWEERALKELLNRMRQQIAKRGKELVFSAIGVSCYNWEHNRISNDDITRYMNELDYIHVLTEKTITCEVCKRSRNNIDVRSPDFTYCKCANKNARRKTFDDWVPFIEKQNMLVWRKLRDSGHYEYKVYGSFNDVSAVDFLNVQIDSQYRKKWDTTAITLEVVDKDPSPTNSDVVYWEILWPKLFINRDYVFNRRFMIDSENKTIVIVNRGTQHPACPIRPDKYRVDEYWSCMVIKPYSSLDKPGIEFGLTYFDNPGVNIPAAVTSWVAIRAMPDFLMRLREATKDYKRYCEKGGNKCVFKLDVQKDEGKATDAAEEFDEIEEVITDNTIFEPQHPIIKTIKSGGRSRSSQTTEPVDRKGGADMSSKISANNAGDVIISPSPIIQAETNKHDYWKYLRPNYYFS